jgi:hypothetical protein
MGKDEKTRVVVGVKILRGLTACECEVKIPKLTEIDRLAGKLNLSSIKTQSINNLQCA